MRLGFFTPSYPEFTVEGGIGTYTHTLAHALSARGHSVQVLTPGSVTTQGRDGPVTINFTSTRHLPVLDRLVPGIGACARVARAMRRLVREHSLDLVEFPNWEGLGLAYSLWRSKPLVVRLSTSTAETVEIDGLEWNPSLLWDARRERWMARRADRLVTHSNAHRCFMAREIGIDSSRIDVIPCGAPRARSNAPASQPSPGHDELTVVFLGRLERRKGALDLLRSIPEVLQHVPRARFRLIGADRPHCPEGRTHLEWAQANLPREVLARIEFAGRLPQGEVDRHMQQADLFVAPSLYESFGLVLIEAMDRGIPVVSTRAGGIPEVVRDGETGLLVEPANPDQLASAIVSLLLDRDRRLVLASAGRQRFLAEFTAERMAERVERHYAQLLSGTRDHVQG